jgi:hypothetical protein
VLYIERLRMKEEDGKEKEERKRNVWGRGSIHRR